jgi:hypothetical protein
MRKFAKDCNRAIARAKNDGLLSLFKSGIRRLFPVKRNAIWNDVVVPADVAAGHKTIDKYISPPFRTDYELSEDGEVQFHEEYTQPGDKVVIIGGGRGVTTVRAAQRCKPDGSVIVYEASDKYANIIEKTIDLNNVRDICEVRNCLVGPNVDVYERNSGSELAKIHPSEIPDCDVLEMDCEGAELDIVANMTIRPRIVIMEVHPQKYEYAEDAITELQKQDYRIEGRRKNTGELLSEEDFTRVLKQCANGEAFAPVLVATDNSPEQTSLDQIG